MHDREGPLGILLSDRVREEYGGRIEAMAARAGIPAVCHCLDTARAALQRIHIAFFSRDLYEGSSLRKPGPMSDAFFSVVDKASRLCWLHVFSSGLDLPQYAHALERGVHVTGSKGVTALPIAQTAVAAILALSRGFGHWLPAQQVRRWAPLSGADRPRDICDQHVLVVGAGPIGCEIGRMLKAIGYRVTAVRSTHTPHPAFDDVIAFDSLDEALPRCDWLVLAAPLTPLTRGMINAKRLRLLGPHAYLANVARGELVDEQALVDALRGGGLKGAYLDTFLEEPLPQASPLWAQPKVWITPHNSAASQGHEERVAECFLDEYAAWLAAQRRNPIDQSGRRVRHAGQQ